MTSRAQLTGQIFIYIVAVVVVGIIFLLGYRYVGEFLVLKCDAEQATFAQTLKTYISSYDGYGEVGKESVKAPCSYRQVCLVDASLRGTSPASGNALIDLTVDSGAEQNLFLVGDKVQGVGWSEKIRVEQGVVCLNNTAGVFTLRFRGQGGTTLIEAVT